MGLEVEVVNQFDEEKADDRCFIAVGKKKTHLLSVYYALRPWIKNVTEIRVDRSLPRLTSKKDRGFEQKTSL